jgi:two-component sensor histidine kinase
VVSMFDLTPYKQAEQQIRASLREKEVLLKEIHHRVKNNLQVISSLLNLQAQHLPEAKSRMLFGEAQRRVQSIALVHERLYQSKDLSHVGFDEYVRALIENLFYTQDAKSRGIEASLRLGAVRLSIDTAIPCGLIVNELVTNALKYAFPEGRHGTIEIHMSTDAAGHVELRVSDDGVGLPPELNPQDTPSLGLELVYAFAQQIDAQVEVLRDHGTGFRFQFQNQAA